MPTIYFTIYLYLVYVTVPPLLTPLIQVHPPSSLMFPLHSLSANYCRHSPPPPLIIPFPSSHPPHHPLRCRQIRKVRFGAAAKIPHPLIPLGTSTPPLHADVPDSPFLSSSANYCRRSSPPSINSIGKSKSAPSASK